MKYIILFSLVAGMLIFGFHQAYSQFQIDSIIDLKSKPVEKIPNKLNIIQTDFPAEYSPEPDIDADLQVDRKPFFDKIILQDLTQYPQSCKDKKIECVVLIRALVDTNGKVIKTVVRETVQAPDSVKFEFNYAAIDAVIKLLCTPAHQNNKRVKCWIDIPVAFKLKDPK